MLNHDNPDPGLTDFIDALQASGDTLIHAEKGMALDLGARARLELIDEDEGNLSILVTWGMARIALLPRTQLSQTASLASLSAIILSSASSARLLQDIEATVGVIEGRNPLANTGSRPTLLATNDRGWIELVTDSERLWIVRLGQPDTKRVRGQTAQVGKALIRPQAFSEDSVPKRTLSWVSNKLDLQPGSISSRSDQSSLGSCKHSGASPSLAPVVASHHGELRLK
jgi:hypothetical protein